MTQTSHLGGARRAAPGGARAPHGVERSRTLAAAMIERLELREDDLLVDLGCADADLDLEILRQMPLRCQLIAVDWSGERNARVPIHRGIRCVRMGLATFCELPVRYDKLLMVDGLARLGGETHHLPSLFERLNDGGALLLVERWDAWRSRAREVEGLLRAGGFRVEAGALTLGCGDRVALVTATRE